MYLQSKEHANAVKKAQNKPEAQEKLKREARALRHLDRRKLVLTSQHQRAPVAHERPDLVLRQASAKRGRRLGDGGARADLRSAKRSDKVARRARRQKGLRRAICSRTRTTYSPPRR